MEETSERNATLLALNKRLISEMKDARAASAKSEPMDRTKINEKVKQLIDNRFRTID